MFVTVSVGVCAFVVLTGSVTQARLVVNGTVNANFRSAYDILVRPPGSETALEATSGLVRPNFLSGIYGGISEAQLKAVRSVKGVDVAAPIAMVGEIMETVDVPIDVTTLVSNSGRSVVRYSSRFVSESGAASSPGPSGYVYVTPSSLSQSPLGSPTDTAGPREQLPSGASLPVCTYEAANTRDASPFTAAHLWGNSCWGRSQGNVSSSWSSLGVGHFAAMIPWSFPVTLAAVDPQAEAALTGINATVTDGRYLRNGDAPTRLPGKQNGVVAVPVIASTFPVVGEQLQVKIESLPESAVQTILAGGSREQTRAEIEALPATSSGQRTATADAVLKDWLAKAHATPPIVDGYWTPGQVNYTRDSKGTLRPETVKVPLSTWRSDLNSGGGGFVAVPPDAAGTSFRTLTPHRLINSAGNANALAMPALTVVGSFDPRKIKGFANLSKVPLETYEAPRLVPADAKSQNTLGGNPLLPDLNPAGYLQQPPLMLTTLKGLSAFTNPLAFTNVDSSAPISVIRVRVAAVTGADAASRERVRLVAEQIQRKTGLKVDITIGSSPAPQTVLLPPSTVGSPPLAVKENWIKKGVATQIVNAVNTKSVALFILVLSACALVIGNAAGASVRARRVELGVLACVGWRPSLLLRSVLREMLFVGSVGAVAGAALSLPIGATLGNPVGPLRVVLAIPAAIAVSLLAGIAPAVRAAATSPAQAVRPATTPLARRIRLRGVMSVAWLAVLRRPARSVAVVFTLALGAGTFTGLLVIESAFQNEVVGTLLGNAVAVQVGTPDVVAAATVSVLGLIAVTDLLFLDLREQSPFYASLKAAGWRPSALIKLVIGQAAILGVAGSILGSAAALCILRQFGTISVEALGAAVPVILAAVLLTVMAAAFPARKLLRQDPAHLLAEE